ncbi:Arc family DNA-binding protein [Vreelandella hamiltonii]|uniref:Arc-like DNA binding domain-containing protein n=1 Tax=Vreelandella hamiltonii TaxID=502829 RepID=A0A8H9I6D4_9GAMM|nr:Arc family DNA-binding protein [Halomonas hamiltonii]GGW23744.1 hypothetical protein GCM10007157_13890 [Halomonas hamiltonii]
MKKDDTYRSQFRLPYSLYEKLKAEAELNHRSLNAELIARLEQSFEGSAPDGLGKMTAHEFLEQQRTTAKQYLEVLEKLQRGEE